MSREQFNQQANGSVYIGAGLTIKKGKRQSATDIAQDTERFLAGGGEIQQLASAQIRPLASPAFNPGDIGDWDE